MSSSSSDSSDDSFGSTWFLAIFWPLRSLRSLRFWRLKSVRNIRNSSIYNIIRWFAGSFVPANHRPSVWCSKYYFLFIISCKILCKNRSKLFYYFLIIKIKSFECPKSIRNYEKKNAWNIRRLVGGSLGQTNQRTSVIYYKLTNFKSV